MHFNTFLIKTLIWNSIFQTNSCSTYSGKPSLQQVSAIPAMVRTRRLAARLLASVDTNQLEKGL